MDPDLDFALAKATRALAIARRLGLDACVIAVDAGGAIIVALRRDTTSAASFEAARRKACTAAALRLPTAAASEMVSRDPVSDRALHAGPDMLAVPGGYPLVRDGRLIGGLGVAGGAWPDDERIAREAVDDG